MTDDLDRIMEAMEASFDPAWGEAWNRRQVGDSLVFPNTHYRLIGFSGDEPSQNEPAAGFALSRAAPGEEELLLVAVRPEARRRGLGRRLLESFACDAADRGAERIYLEMRENNPAVSLYRSLGFEPIGRRRDYYRLPGGERIDAITFGKEL